MEYVRELNQRLDAVDHLLIVAGETAERAKTNWAEQKKLQNQLGRIRGQLKVIGVAASRVLVEVDVLDAMQRRASDANGGDRREAGPGAVDHGRRGRSYRSSGR